MLGNTVESCQLARTRAIVPVEVGAEDDSLSPGNVFTTSLEEEKTIVTFENSKNGEGGLYYR